MIVWIWFGWLLLILIAFLLWYFYDAILDRYYHGKIVQKGSNFYTAYSGHRFFIGNRTCRGLLLVEVGSDIGGAYEYTLSFLLSTKIVAKNMDEFSEKYPEEAI